MEVKGKRKIQGGEEWEGGGIHFYGGQFGVAAVHRCPLRVILKETRDLHVLMTVGRAFHILVAYEQK